MVPENVRAFVDFQRASAFEERRVREQVVERAAIDLADAFITRPWCEADDKAPADKGAMDEADEAPADKRNSVRGKATGAADVKAKPKPKAAAATVKKAQPQGEVHNPR
jgi:hypothetical protein